MAKRILHPRSKIVKPPDTMVSAGTPAPDLFAGGGEMGALVRAKDWSETPIGPIENWPQSLLTTVSTCLSSRFPILIWWGAEHVKIYNDAYRPMLALYIGGMGARTKNFYNDYVKRLVAVWDTKTQNQNSRDPSAAQGAWVYWREE